MTVTFPTNLPMTQKQKQKQKFEKVAATSASACASGVGRHPRPHDRRHFSTCQSCQFNQRSTQIAGAAPFAPTPRRKNVQAALFSNAVVSGSKLIDVASSRLPHGFA